MEIIRTSLAQPPNPNITYEFLGYGASGFGTLLTSGGGNFVKGSWTSLGIPSADICEFDVVFAISSSSGNRIHCDIGVGPNSSSVTVVAPDIYTVTSVPGTTYAPDVVTLPLKLAAGVEVWARISGQASGVTHVVAIRAVQASRLLPPGFDHCEVINGGQSTGRAGAALLTMNDGYVPLIDPTARAYGALLCSFGQSATTAVVQDVTIRWGGGLSGFETIFHRTRTGAANGNPIMKTGGQRRLVQTSFPSNMRFAAAALGDKTTTETMYAGLHGFY